MTEAPEPLAADRKSPTPDPGMAAGDVGRSIPRLILLPVAFLLGAAAVYLLGLDAVWPALAGGAVTAGLVFVADFVITSAVPFAQRHRRLIQVLALVVIVIGVVYYYRWERVRAFQIVFGVDPPSGIHGVDIERFRAHDTGRDLTILQFETTRAGVDRLIAARDFKERLVTVRPGREAKAQRGTWSSAFAEYGLTVVDRWKNRLPVTEPYIYRWNGNDRQTLGQQTTLLWDAESGRGYAVHAFPVVVGIRTP